MSDAFTYSIDTSALIHGWVRAYPIEVPIFRPVWDRLAELIADGRLKMSVEVLNEIEKKDDGLAEWCRSHDGFVVDIDDSVQVEVATIMGRYPRLVDTKKGKSGADPFVIALARAHRPALTIVTEEKGGSVKSPKIAYVCQEEDIRCISLLELIQEQS